VFYSVILPTFGRPDDVNEFLESLTKQDYKNFEVIIVDATLNDVVKLVADNFSGKLNLTYFYEKGLGISDSRNLGVKHSKGDYVVFIDSDCVVPPHYFSEIEKYLNTNKADAYGGPDAASTEFTYAQKAINYVMTSFLTTGGIRGKKKRVSRYELRGFNMGISRVAFDAVEGYSSMKVAEDIDLSMRLHKAGFKTGLIPNAYVYHKRKTSLYKFYVQMFMYGKARIDLFLRHKEALKITYLLPLLFLIYLVSGFLSFTFNNTLFLAFAGTLVFYAFAVFTGATIQNKNLIVGLLSAFAAYEFLVGYGLGLIYNIFRRVIFRREEIKRAKILKE